MDWMLFIPAVAAALGAGVLLGRRRGALADKSALFRTIAAAARSAALNGWIVNREGEVFDAFGATAPGERPPAREDLRPWRADIVRAIEIGETRQIEPLIDGKCRAATVQPVMLGDAATAAHGALIVLRGEALRDDSSIEDLSARNAAILQSSLDGFFIIADNHRFIEVNAAYSRMVGYTPSELLKMRLSDVEVPLTRDGGRAATNISRTGHHLFAAQHRHKEGHIVELEISVIAIKIAGRKTLVGFARNVTDRLRAERTLAEREKQYRDLVETSHDLIWSVDREGRWTFVNREAVTRIYGYEPEDMLGRPFSDFMPPEDVRKDVKLFERILAGEPCYGYETTHLRRDGAPITLRFNAIAMRDESGAVIGTTGTAADITAGRQAEERLRSATERFESVVRCMPVAYVFWSRDFRVQEWNPAAESVFGYSAEEAIGRNGEELIVADASRDELREMWSDLVGGTPRDHGVFTLKRKNGEAARCEWSNAVVHGADGTVSHVGTLIRDISERERLESQLRRTQKMESLGILAGGVAHDFNNALVGILCNASLALEKLPPDAESRMYLTRILNAARRSSELTRQMLVYAGRATPDVKPLDLNELIREWSDLLRASIPRSVTLTVNTEPELPLVLADAGQMQQVVMNLLMNAAEAIGENTGVVTIASYTRSVTARDIAAMYAESNIEPGAFACLEVSDTGCGMTPETQAKIFDPFFTTKFTGRGLGLAAILGIVRTHRGVIRVSSRVGQGTVFTVLLPVCRTPVRAAPTDRSGNSRALAGKTILVVDDEPEIRDVVESVLRGRDCRTLAASDGAEATALFRKHHSEVDLVFLDLTMPGMSGEAVLGELLRIAPSAKVVISSGYVDARASRPSTLGRAAAFIQKPFTIEELADILGGVLLNSAGQDAVTEKSV